MARRRQWERSSLRSCWAKTQLSTQKKKGVFVDTELSSPSRQAPMASQPANSDPGSWSVLIV